MGFTWEADENEFFVGKIELLTAGNIPKPIQTGFEVLAQLKEQRIEVQRQKLDNRFGMLATKTKKKDIALVVYNYEETDKSKNTNSKVLIQLNDLEPNSTYKIIEIRIDENNNNT